MKLSQDLQALQSLLACAPLSPPVDYYNLTSKFGTVKTIHEKTDWHEGVDLGAWPGTRVAQPHLVLSPLLVARVGMVDLFFDHGCGIETA